MVSKDGVAGPLPVQPSLLQEAPGVRWRCRRGSSGVSRPHAAGRAQVPTAMSPGLLQRMTSGWQLSTAGTDCHCTTGTKSRCQQGWLSQRIKGRDSSWPPAASGGCQSASLEPLSLVTRSLCHMTAWKSPASPKSSRYKSLDLITSAKPLIATQVTPHRVLKSLGACPAHHAG